VWNDLLTLATNNEWNYSQLSNPELMWFLSDPLTSPDPYNGNVPDGVPWWEALQTAFPGASAAAADSAGGASAASELSTGLSALLAGAGTTAGADALSAAFAEISAAITADLAQVVPQSILSMF